MLLDIKKTSFYLQLPHFLILIDTLYLLNVSSSFMTNAFLICHTLCLSRCFHKEVKYNKIEKRWWKRGWNNNCGFDYAGRGEEKSLYVKILCFTFSPVVWASVCGLFVVESVPSLSANLMLPCSLDVARFAKEWGIASLTVSQRLHPNKSPDYMT